MALGLVREITVELCNKDVRAQTRFEEHPGESTQIGHQGRQLYRKALQSQCRVQL